MKISISPSRRAMRPLVLMLAFLAALAAHADPVSVSISGLSQVTYVPGAYHSFNHRGETPPSPMHSLSAAEVAE
ncbi:MAG TPA: hypothetical protein VKT49_17160 [Bryobacteraceae bacterium]|nr:hypothetical protein [Bryobacteraceae bacterium]